MNRSTRRTVNRVAKALRLAANSLRSSASYLGAFFRRMRARFGSAKAITATARKLACQIYRMLMFGQEYVDRGEGFYESQYREKVVKISRRRRLNWIIN